MTLYLVVSKFGKYNGIRYRDGYDSTTKRHIWQQLEAVYEFIKANYAVEMCEYQTFFDQPIIVVKAPSDTISSLIANLRQQNIQHRIPYFVLDTHTDYQPHP